MEEREADWDPRINFTSEFKGDKSRNLQRKSHLQKFKRYSVKSR